MAQQEKIIQHLTSFFRQDSKRIKCAALIGSFGRGKGSSASDIDIELLMANDQINIHEFTTDIIEIFQQTDESLFVKHTLWLDDQRKLALYHGPQLLLTELYLYTQLSQFDKYFLGSRITNLDTCILFDPENILRKHFQYILRLPYDDHDGLIRNLISSIQFQLESTLSARQRRDAYKFYFLSNITLHELVRLCYLLDGKIEYNYNPPQSIVDQNFASTMDLNQTKDHLKKLIDLFLKQFDRMEDQQMNLIKNARSFCDDLMKRECIEEF